jgi:hypothetical protein
MSIRLRKHRPTIGRRNLTATDYIRIIHSLYDINLHATFLRDNMVHTSPFPSTAQSLSASHRQRFERPRPPDGLFLRKFGIGLLATAPVKEGVRL